jgi:hypothetical protein
MPDENHAARGRALRPFVTDPGACLFLEKIGIPHTDILKIEHVLVQVLGIKYRSDMYGYLLYVYEYLLYMYDMSEST